MIIPRSPGLKLRMRKKWGLGSVLASLSSLCSSSSHVSESLSCQGHGLGLLLLFNPQPVRA